MNHENQEYLLLGAVIPVIGWVIWALFWRKSESIVEQTEVKVIPRDRCELTPTEWRTNAPLVTEAAKIVTNENFRLMEDTIKNTGPATWVLTGVSMEERAAHQARIEGYLMALTDLKALGTFQKEKKETEIEATFQPE